MDIIETNVDAEPSVSAEEEIRQIALTQTRHEFVAALEALGWKLITGPQQTFDICRASPRVT